MDDALKTAEKIASQSRPVVMMIKESVNVAFSTTLQEGLRFESRAFHATFATEDAFLEKRKPAFKHR